MTAARLNLAKDIADKSENVPGRLLFGNLPGTFYDVFGCYFPPFFSFATVKTAAITLRTRRPADLLPIFRTL